jgi:CubicO group peptidase (beta-lactamase class C family)
VFAYRVMKLAEEGILDLDAPLTRYSKQPFVKGDSRLELITARRVLCHTTGLPNWRNKEEPLRINFTPGEKWAYSGEGYHYLQSVVTQLVGRTDSNNCGTYELKYRLCASDFAEYMAAKLLRPFGMTSSAYVWTAVWLSRVAVNHCDGLRKVSARDRRPQAAGRVPFDGPEPKRNASASRGSAGVTIQDVVGTWLADLASRKRRRRGPWG